MIALCTDSSALLPEHLVAGLGVAVAPVGVTLDGKAYEEGLDLDVDGFYDRLRLGARATTSQPSPGSFALLYQEAVDAGATDVLSLHVAGALSGAIDSASVAARTARVPVTVVDTGTVSFGVAICVLAAAQAIAKGRSLDDVIARVREASRRIGNVFVAGNPPVGRLVSAPGLPLLSFVDGETRSVGVAIDLADAATEMAEFVAGQGERLRVAVGHASIATREASDLLAAALGQSRSITDVIRYRVGPSVGAHTGPLSFGAFWWSS